MRLYVYQSVPVPCSSLPPLQCAPVFVGNCSRQARSARPSRSLSGIVAQPGPRSTEPKKLRGVDRHGGYGSAWRYVPATSTMSAAPLIVEFDCEQERGPQEN